MIVVEEFTEEDAQRIEHVLNRVWSQSFEYPSTWREKRQLKKEEIVQEMRNGYHFFGVRDEGKVVGVYKLILTEEGCFGEHQSILPEYTDRGIASAMYDQFIAYAEAHHCIPYVNILVTHKACKRLVEKHGFSKVGEEFEQAEGMKVQKYARR